MTELIAKLIRDMQTMIFPMIPVIGVYLIVRGLIRLANANEAAQGGKGGVKMIIIGSFLTCYKLTSSIVVSTLQKCGLNLGNILPM